MSLQSVLNATPVDTIYEAIDAMKAIDDALPESDGIRWFNRLYLRVTIGIAEAVRGGVFRDPGFLATLDVVFANQYFSTLTTALSNVEAAPAAWRPLLRARHSRGIARIQFALAGMNAHINRDLPDGIVQSFLALGGDPMSDRVRELDFDRVNDLLEQVEEDVKRELSVGVIQVIDRLGGPVDDAIAIWNVRAARSAAWTHAQVLWSLDALPELRNRYFDKLDRMVGMTGRGLLLPLDPSGAGHGAPGTDLTHVPRRPRA